MSFLRKSVLAALCVGILTVLAWNLKSLRMSSSQRTVTSHSDYFKGGALRAPASEKLKKPENQINVEVATLLVKSKCARQSTETLDNWNVVREWTRTASDLDGGKFYMSPTDRIGVWVRVAFYPNGSVEAVRISPESEIRVTWALSGCTPRLQPRMIAPPPARVPANFTDSDLQAIVDRGGNALIYGWSPHMPISLKGISTAREVAAKNNIEFILLLDPAADARGAQTAAQQNNLPPEALRRPESVELFARGMYLHFPASLVIAKGKFSKLYPGLPLNGDVLDKFVKGNLQ